MINLTLKMSQEFTSFFLKHSWIPINIADVWKWKENKSRIASNTCRLQRFSNFLFLPACSRKIIVLFCFLLSTVKHSLNFSGQRLFFLTTLKQYKLSHHLWRKTILSLLIDQTTQKKIKKRETREWKTFDAEQLGRWVAEKKFAISLLCDCDVVQVTAFN